MRTTPAIAVLSMILGCQATACLADPSAGPAASATSATSAASANGVTAPDPEHRRILTFPATDADGKPVTVEQVCKAVAAAYVGKSKYGALHETERHYSETTISGNGITHSGPWNAQLRGVAASAGKDNVQVDYMSVTQYSKGDKFVATTRAILTVAADNEHPGRFLVSPSTVQERIPKGLFSMVAQKPLDSLENIKADIAAVIDAIQPQIALKRSQTDEFEVNYPPASVFANYERLLGKATRTDDRNGDVREAMFNFPNHPIPVTIKVFPYRSGSKVQASYSQTYLLNPDGTSSFQPERMTEIGNRLQKIARD